MSTTGTVHPDPELVDRARRLFDDLGAKGGAEKLGVSMTSFLRLAAGGSVRAGTIALIRMSASRDHATTPERNRQ